jgi:hypothetical protein
MLIPWVYLLGVVEVMVVGELHGLLLAVVVDRMISLRLLHHRHQGRRLDRRVRNWIVRLHLVVSRRIAPRARVARLNLGHHARNHNHLLHRRLHALVATLA